MNTTRKCQYQGHQVLEREIMGGGSNKKGQFWGRAVIKSDITGKGHMNLGVVLSKDNIRKGLCFERIVIERKKH